MKDANRGLSNIAPSGYADSCSGIAFSLVVLGRVILNFVGFPLPLAPEIGGWGREVLACTLPNSAPLDGSASFGKCKSTIEKAYGATFLVFGGAICGQSLLSIVCPS